MADLIIGKVSGFACGRKTKKTSGPLAADQAPADDWLWDGLAEGLRKFHFIYRALFRKNLHHVMRITELLTQALFGQERD